MVLSIVRSTLSLHKKSIIYYNADSLKSQAALCFLGGLARDGKAEKKRHFFFNTESSDQLP